MSKQVTQMQRIILFVNAYLIFYLKRDHTTAKKLLQYDPTKQLI